MKKNNFIYSIITVTFLIAGSVSAYTEPSGAFPNGNVDPVVDVSVQKQEKTGPFWARFLKGGLQDLVSGTGDVTEFFIGDKAAMAVQGFFTYVFLPGEKSQLRVGDANGGDGTRNTLFTYIIDKYPAVTTIMNTNRAPVTVDLAGRGTSAGDAEGREALALLSDTNYCSSSVVTNTSAISLLNDISKTPADLLARQVQLSGGEPARNKVLVATDTDGNAVWGTISIANGQVVVNYDGAKSPVKAGQEICSPAPVDACPNIAGIQPPGTSCVEPYWEIAKYNIKNNPNSTSTNWSALPKAGEECGAYLKQAGGYDTELRVARYDNQYANFGPFGKNMPSRERMLPLGRDLGPNGIPMSTPSKSVTASGNCLYRAQVVYTPGDPSRPNNPIPINGLWDSQVPTADYNSYWKTECLVLPVGQKPPTNQKWADNTSWIKVTSQPNKSKEWKPSISCTPVDKVQGGFCAGNPPLMDPVMCTIRAMDNPYQLQYLVK